jgi:hypothetical protein
VLCRSDVVRVRDLHIHQGQVRSGRDLRSRPCASLPPVTKSI